MKMFSSSFEEHPSSSGLSHHLEKIDPEIYGFLKEHDSELLESGSAVGFGEDHHFEDADSSDEASGNVEPRPLDVTSRKNVSDCLLLALVKPQNVFVYVSELKLSLCRPLSMWV